MNRLALRRLWPVDSTEQTSPRLPGAQFQSRGGVPPGICQWGLVPGARPRSLLLDSQRKIPGRNSRVGGGVSGGGVGFGGPQEGNTVAGRAQTCVVQPRMVCVSAQTVAAAVIKGTGLVTEVTNATAVTESQQGAPLGTVPGVARPSRKHSRHTQTPRSPTPSP